MPGFQAHFYQAMEGNLIKYRKWIMCSDLNPKCLFSYFFLIRKDFQINFFSFCISYDYYKTTV